MRPHGRAKVSAGRPVAQAQCDRCGFWYNRTDLQFQQQWSATHIYSLGVLVCRPCLDIPQEQLRVIILPADPPPVVNARPPNFTYEETGPVQAILAASAPAGTNQLTLLPASGTIQDANSFSIGNNVVIQLNNASFAEETITAVDTVNNILTIANPLPALAPINGSVTLALT